MEDEEGDEETGTHTIVQPGRKDERPAVTLSVPKERPVREEGSTSTPPTRITAVKATIESMLGRRKSFGEVFGEALERPKAGVFVPTARPPPLEERKDFQA